MVQYKITKMNFPCEFSSPLIGWVRSSPFDLLYMYMYKPKVLWQQNTE